MLCPVALPRTAADVPRQHIVFQPVDLVLRQAGKTGLEAGEHLFITEAGAHGLERADDQCHWRAGQQIGLFREEHGYIVPRHRHREKAGIGRNVARRDDEIAITRALVAHLAADIGRRVFTLVKGRGRRIQAHTIGYAWIRAAHGQQAFRFDRRERRRTRHARHAQFDVLNRSIVALCHTGQCLDRLAAGHENVGLRRVTGDCRRERHTRRQHRLNDRQFLRGKAQKAVQIDLRAREHMALRQAVTQMGQAVARVGQRLLTQAVVSCQQLRKVGQLARKRFIFAGLRSIKQRFGRDRTGFALVDQPQRLTQQLGLVGKAAPRGQAALHAARGFL